MSRTALPLAVVVAASLVCPEAAAAPVRSTLASWSAAAHTQPEAAPEAAPVSEAPPPAPQPYADPSATATPPEGPAAGTVYAPPPSPPRSRRKGLMIAGWTMFGASYLFTALIAGIVHDTCSIASAPNCRRAAGYSLIPLIGPFLTIPYLRTDAITPKVFMALPALVQIAGLAMGIAGTIQFVNDGKASRVADVDGFKLGRTRLRANVGPTPFLDGGTFMLGGRF
ncbi:hypothetical protein [Nannocystis radixulma]|uniref:Uncharacterized protein n=1 Tax=Nannocystis radixulma TaxID=2995305 RepID=A0ABT5BG86_9BACT|nr:hypothetical protein [Nannocystis radixulma]MDC0669084.1 hypothetical protein [Nannocystis radixulma]MDC0673157.1 hypothetical protein [Nannocystis radixulma]